MIQAKRKKYLWISMFDAGMFAGWVWISMSGVAEVFLLLFPAPSSAFAAGLEETPFPSHWFVYG